MPFIRPRSRHHATAWAWAALPARQSARPAGSGLPRRLSGRRLGTGGQAKSMITDRPNDNSFLIVFIVQLPFSDAFAQQIHAVLTDGVSHQIDICLFYIIDLPEAFPEWQRSAGKICPRHFSVRPLTCRVLRLESAPLFAYKTLPRRTLCSPHVRPNGHQRRLRRPGFSCSVRFGASKAVSPSSASLAFL